MVLPGISPVHCDIGSIGSGDPFQGKLEMSRTLEDSCCILLKPTCSGAR